MSKMVMNEKEAIEMLNDLRRDEVSMWSTFFLGTPITLGTKRVYKTKGAAKARVHDFLYWGRGLSTDRIEAKKQARNLADKLEKSGLLEYRQSTDLSPRFPHTIPGIDEQQVDKFRKMLDSEDSELVNLAITTLEGIKNM